MELRQPVYRSRASGGAFAHVRRQVQRRRFGIAEEIAAGRAYGTQRA